MVGPGMTSVTVVEVDTVTVEAYEIVDGAKVVVAVVEAVKLIVFVETTSTSFPQTTLAG